MVAFSIWVYCYQGYNARKVSCSYVYSAYTLKLWAEFVNKNRIRCNSVRLVSRRLKSLNFDNSHNSFLRLEYFIDFVCERTDPLSGVFIRLVFTFPPRDSTLQYKRCIHLWNNFPCIITLIVIIQIISLNKVLSFRFLGLFS